MAKTKKQLHEALRNKYLDLITQFLTEQGEEVLRVKSNEIAFPVVDEERNDEFVKIAISVPTGSRDDGEAFDGARELAKKEGIFAGSSSGAALAAAKKLIESGEHMVKEVASLSGYTRPARFSSTYAAFWGSPPTALLPKFLGVKKVRAY